MNREAKKIRNLFCELILTQVFTERNLAILIRIKHIQGFLSHKGYILTVQHSVHDVLLFMIKQTYDWFGPLSRITCFAYSRQLKFSWNPFLEKLVAKSGFLVTLFRLLISKIEVLTVLKLS